MQLGNSIIIASLVILVSAVLYLFNRDSIWQERYNGEVFCHSYCNDKRSEIGVYRQNGCWCIRQHYEVDEADFNKEKGLLELILKD